MLIWRKNNNLSFDIYIINGDIIIIGDIIINGDIINGVIIKLISCHWSLDTPWKHQKIRGFPMFSGGIRGDEEHEMG